MAKAKADRSDRDGGSGAAGGYPYHLLPAALKLGEAVKNNGRRDVQRAVLAGALQMAEAGFSQLCASAKTYGIVEGSRSLSLTELGNDYFFPTTPASERRALLGFFASPSVFRDVIAQLDGSRLPSTSLLANALQRQFGVPQSWAGRAASIFIGTAGTVNAIDSGGFLRYSAALHAIDKEASSANVVVAPGPAELKLQTHAPNVVVGRSDPTPGALSGVASLGFGASGALAASPNNIWSYSEAGGTVRLETSEPMPRALWDRLTKYVAMLEPTSSSSNSGTLTVVEPLLPLVHHQQGGRTDGST